MSMQTTHKISN